MDQLKANDALAASVQRTPNRISADHMEGLIVSEFYLNGAAAIGATELRADISAEPWRNVAALTICILVTRNGTPLVGSAVPADPGNFNPEIGRQFARQDAMRKLQEREGYMLRQRLHDAYVVAAAGPMDEPPPA